jgi:hypothetical protein
MRIRDMGGWVQAGSSLELSAALWARPLQGTPSHFDGKAWAPPWAFSAIDLTRDVGWRSIGPDELPDRRRQNASTSREGTHHARCAARRQPVLDCRYRIGPDRPSRPRPAHHRPPGQLFHWRPRRKIRHALDAAGLRAVRHHHRRPDVCALSGFPWASWACRSR